MKKFLEKLTTKYYQIKHEISDTYYSIKRYLINIYVFRKELSNCYPWNEDYGLLRKQIELMCECIKNGNEERISANKKITKMERVIYLLKCFEKDNFIDIAEEQLGYQLSKWDFELKEVNINGKTSYQRIEKRTEEEIEKDRKIYQLSIEIEQQYWNELWDILKGQNPDDYKRKDNKTDDPDEFYNNWLDWFDGSGYAGWWD